MPDSTLRCLHHLREQFASLRLLGPLPAIVVELPVGSRVDQDAIRVAGRSLARCDAEWSRVIGCLDPARGGRVRVYAPARADTAWERFDGVSQDARRTASRLLVDAGILRAVDAELGPWIVDVARALESLDDADPCPARLAGGSARLWTPIGKFLTSEHTVRTPFPMFSELLNGVTDVRHLVVRDATEASIAILDLLVGRLESVQPEEKGFKGKSLHEPKKHRKIRGRRRNLDGDRKEDRAAFWALRAVDLVFEDELRHALDLMGPDARPRDVYQALELHGLEISYRAVRNDPPSCWPRFSDGTPKPSWSFKDYAADVGVKAFERYIREHRRHSRGEPVVAPRAACAADLPGNVPPPSRPGLSRSQIRTRAVVDAAEAVENELCSVQAAMRSGIGAKDAWESLGRVLVERGRLAPKQADELMGARDQGAIDNIATWIVRHRKKAGDTGERDCRGDRRRGRNGH